MQTPTANSLTANAFQLNKLDIIGPFVDALEAGRQREFRTGRPLGFGESAEDKEFRRNNPELFQNRNTGGADSEEGSQQDKEKRTVRAMQRIVEQEQKSMFENLYTNTAKFVGGYVDKAQKLIGNIAEGAMDLADKAGKTLSNAMDAAKEKAGDMMDSAKQKAGELASNAKTMAADGWQSATNFVFGKKDNEKETQLAKGNDATTSSKVGLEEATNTDVAGANDISTMSLKTSFFAALGLKGNEPAAPQPDGNLKLASSQPAQAFTP